MMKYFSPWTCRRTKKIFVFGGGCRMMIAVFLAFYLLSLGAIVILLGLGGVKLNFLSRPLPAQNFIDRGYGDMAEGRRGGHF